MKKNVIILLAMVLSFTGCSHSFSSIEPNEVEKIIIWTHQSERELSKDNCVKIINQYNESVYGGEATGEGGTPDFGIIIFYGYPVDASWLISYNLNYGVSKKANGF